MGQRRLRYLETLVARWFSTCWVAVTRLVVGLGVGVLIVAALLLMPWAMAVLLAVVIVWLPGRAKLTAAWREILPLDRSRRWHVGLLTAAVPACFGWNLVLGPYGVAVVGVDVLVGLPVLLLSTGRAELPDGDGVGAWPAGALGRLRLGLDRLPDQRRRPASDGLDDFLPDLANVSQPSADQPRLLAQLSDAELRHAWQSSCRALLMVHDAAVTQRIVTARARYLDAIEQRDPERFRLWALSSLSATQPLRDGSELDH